MAKQDLPNANSIGSGNLTSEYSQMTYLYSLLPRTSSGDITYTSTSSGITYSTATYSSGKFANQGQNGMLSLLGEILASNLITSTDFNNKTETSAFNTHLADLAPHSAATNIPRSTTANLTYYVDTTNGLDTNDGLLAGAGHAFKTIAKAVSIIPQIVNHDVVINLAAGTYAEDVNITGFLGKGTLSLLGDTVVSSSYSVKSLTLARCTVYVSIRGLNFTTTTTDSITASSMLTLVVTYCNIVQTAMSNYGITIHEGIAILQSSTISNKSVAIYGWQGCVISSENNTGTGNTYGLAVISAATIGKTGTQPSGTTAETTSGGGVIR